MAYTLTHTHTHLHTHILTQFNEPINAFPALLLCHNVLRSSISISLFFLFFFFIIFFFKFNSVWDFVQIGFIYWIYYFDIGWYNAFWIIYGSWEVVTPEWQLQWVTVVWCNFIGITWRFLNDFTAEYYSLLFWLCSYVFFILIKKILVFYFEFLKNYIFYDNKKILIK